MQIIDLYDHNTSVLFYFRYLKYILHRSLFLSNLNLSKLINTFKLVNALLNRADNINAYPFLIKLDLTPFCHLKCPSCIHNHNDNFPKQSITKNMMMSFSLFKKICDEIAGKTIALDLFFFGDSFHNKNIHKMIRYATNMGINTHLSTSFSYNFTCDDIRNIILSGLSIITICLDGYSQEVYRQYRIGGNVDLVKQNLISLVTLKKKLDKSRPIIVVQFLIFPHNIKEKESVYKFCKQVNVDFLVFKKGSISNKNDYYAKIPYPKDKKLKPICIWPYFCSVILFDGDVIPCCRFRTYELYAKNIPRKSLGNIRANQFLEIFNNNRYQMARKLCNDPIIQPSVINHFCFSCKEIYH